MSRSCILSIALRRFGIMGCVSDVDERPSNAQIREQELHAELVSIADCFKHIHAAPVRQIVTL